MLKIARIIELVISALIMISIVAVLAFLVAHMINSDWDYLRPENFQAFLAILLSVVIGVEFLKMLIKHTPGAAIEVLLFAITRQLIVFHTSSWELFLGIVAVAGVFAIRKFIYIPTFDEDERVIVSAKRKVKQINRMFNIKIPADGELTIGEVVGALLELKGEKIAEGSCVHFPSATVTIVSLGLENEGIIEIVPKNLHQ